MALPTLATVADLETRAGVPIGSIAGENLARAQADLEDASTLIRTYADKMWVAEDGVTITAPDAVKVVCVRAAYRSYRNQEELTSANYAGAYTWSTEETGVYLTEDEKSIIDSALVAGTPGPDSGSWNGTGSVRTPSAYYNPGTSYTTLYYPWGW